MGIFGNKKTDTTKEGKAKSTAKASTNPPVEEPKKKDQGTDTTLWTSRKALGVTEHVLKKPRVTEKAAVLGGNNVYTFEIASQYGKNEVVKAFKKIYDKTPVKVNIINLPTKKKRTRFGIGNTKRKKKALVFLKKGETIDFV